MDAAFAPRPFAGYTTAQLRQTIIQKSAMANKEDRATVSKMAAEVARREQVAAGDMTVAYPSERLRQQREVAQMRKQK